MSFESTKGLGHGGAGMHGDGPRKMITELQGLTTAVVLGGPANTDLPIPEMSAGDTIQSILATSDGTAPALIPNNVATCKNGAVSLSMFTSTITLVINYYRKAGPV